MKLYLIRHGKAKSELQDAEMPLSDEGFADIHRLASFLNNNFNLEPLRIFHSGFTRTRQTAEVIADILNSPFEPIAAEGLTPEAETCIWKKRLSETGNDNILLVSHMPYLEKLCAELLRTGEGLRPLSFTPGAMACLIRHSSEYNEQWELQWFLNPKVLKHETQ